MIEITAPFLVRVIQIKEGEINIKKGNKLTRREFIKITGQSALGLAIASQIGCDEESGRIQESAWRDLQSNLEGMLLRPGDEAYPRIALPWNLDYSNIRPQAIVLAANPGDVQTALLFAREHDIPAVPRSGNHSYAAYSSTTGLTIDLSKMSSINVNDSTGVVDIAAGAQLGSVADATAPFSLVVPAGHCASVGVSGLVLGGGFGYNGRKFGLTSDNLVQTQIVTADGELLNCNESENADLFWACRGGGGGNFGINVGFQIQGHSVSKAAVYQLTWDVSDAEQVWAAMQQIALDTSDDFSMRLSISISEEGPSPGSTNVSVETNGQYFGSVSDLEDILAPAFNVATPTSSVIEELSFADATLFLEERSNPNAFLTKSAYLSEPLSDDAISTMISRFSSEYWPSDSRDASFTIFTWGGAYNNMSPDETAFVHRSAVFVNESCASWHLGDPQSIEDASREWLQELFVALQPSFNGSAYQNFIDPTLEDWQMAYYGENFPRLVEVKRLFDPDNYFRFAQSIPTKI